MNPKLVKQLEEAWLRTDASDDPMFCWHLGDKLRDRDLEFIKLVYDNFYFILADLEFLNGKTD
jgi:hypothetical protein